MGAQDMTQYLRMAEMFTTNLRGAKRFPVDGFTPGVTRYVKKDRYLDLAPDDTIISFGLR